PPDGSHELIGEEVRAADVPDLPLVHEVVEGAEGLVDRRRQVVAVQLVEVDVIGPQPPQRRLDRGQDVLAGVALVERRGTGGREALGGDEERVPLAAQPAPEDLLGAPAGGQVPAERIRVGAVEEIDPALGGPVENGNGGGLVALEPERHRAQAQSRDLQAGPAKSGVFHTRTLSVRCPGTIGRSAPAGHGHDGCGVSPAHARRLAKCAGARGGAARGSTVGWPVLETTAGTKRAVSGPCGCSVSSSTPVAVL